MRRFTSRPKPSARLFRKDRPDRRRARRDGRNARRRSARGSTTPRPAPRCNRRAARIWCAAAKPRRSRRPAPSATRRPSSHSASISGGAPSMRYSLGMPMRMPFTPASMPFVIGHRRIDAGGILFGIVARHRAQHDRRVAHGARHRPRLIQRRGERDDAPARTAAIGRLHADDAADRRRLADGAARIGAGAGERRARRHRRRRTARRTAGHQALVAPARAPRIEHGAVMAGLVRTTPWRIRPCWSCPASPRRRSTNSASPWIRRSARNCSRMLLPAVVRTPLVQNRSLIASGRPSSARALPLAMRASDSAAVASARSGVSVRRRSASARLRPP